MKVVFAGPSLYGADFDRRGIEFRPPARQGDIARAVLQGATIVGLIDGVFGSTAAVWHKEILFALASGARVLGASSMGALRAAECVSYGMEPIGEIAAAYLKGANDDDAAVALTFGPAELGHPPLSEPLVDVVDRLERLKNRRAVTSDEVARLDRAARSIFYADRTIETMLDAAIASHARRSEIAALWRGSTPALKQRDALLLLKAIHCEAAASRVPPTWQPTQPAFWLKTLAEIADDAIAGVTFESRSA